MGTAWSSAEFWVASAELSNVLKILPTCTSSFRELQNMSLYCSFLVVDRLRLEIPWQKPWSICVYIYIQINHCITWPRVPSNKTTDWAKQLLCPWLPGLNDLNQSNCLQLSSSMSATHAIIASRLCSVAYTPSQCFNIEIWSTNIFLATISVYMYMYVRIILQFLKYILESSVQYSMLHNITYIYPH